MADVDVSNVSPPSSQSAEGSGVLMVSSSPAKGIGRYTSSSPPLLSVFHDDRGNAHNGEPTCPTTGAEVEPSSTRRTALSYGKEAGRNGGRRGLKAAVANKAEPVPTPSLFSAKRGRDREAAEREPITAGKRGAADAETGAGEAARTEDETRTAGDLRPAADSAQGAHALTQRRIETRRSQKLSRETEMAGARSGGAVLNRFDSAEDSSMRGFALLARAQRRKLKGAGAAAAMAAAHAAAEGPVPLLKRDSAFEIGRMLDEAEQGCDDGEDMRHASQGSTRRGPTLRRSFSSSSTALGEAVAALVDERQLLGASAAHHPGARRVRLQRFDSSGGGESFAPPLSRNTSLRAEAGDNGGCSISLSQAGPSTISLGTMDMLTSAFGPHGSPERRTGSPDLLRQRRSPTPRLSPLPPGFGMALEDDPPMLAATAAAPGALDPLDPPGAAWGLSHQRQAGDTLGTVAGSAGTSLLEDLVSDEDWHLHGGVGANVGIYDEDTDDEDDAGTSSGMSETGDEMGLGSDDAGVSETEGRAAPSRSPQQQRRGASQRRSRGQGRTSAAQDRDGKGRGGGGTPKAKPRTGRAGSGGVPPRGRPPKRAQEARRRGLQQRAQRERERLAQLLAETRGERAIPFAELQLRPAEDVSEIEDFAPPTAQDFTLGKYLRYLDRKRAGKPWRPDSGSRGGKEPLLVGLVSEGGPLLRYIFP